MFVKHLIFFSKTIFKLKIFSEITGKRIPKVHLEIFLFEISLIKIFFLKVFFRESLIKCFFRKHYK